MNKPLKDIESEKDVELLVHRFYDRVRLHPVISHFFNETIENWDTHMQKLTQFWMANLFGQTGFSGHPMKVHIEVDQAFDNQIDQADFGHWLQLWFSTVDSLFVG